MTDLQQTAEPVCPSCKGAVLYECVFCSSNNYPPASPPKRTWVGLTDEEYQEILKQHNGAGLLAFYNLVEAKLKERNT